jgi:hypothetical protein
MFGRLKDRRIATRYDKFARNLLAAVAIAASRDISPQYRLSGRNAPTALAAILSWVDRAVRANVPATG